MAYPAAQSIIATIPQYVKSTIARLGQEEGLRIVRRTAALWYDVDPTVASAYYAAIAQITEE